MKKELLSVTIIVVMESNYNEHCLSITTIIFVAEWQNDNKQILNIDANII